MEVKSKSTFDNNQLALSAIRLLNYEESIRKVSSSDELLYHMCNKMRELLDYDFSVICSVNNKPILKDKTVEILKLSDVNEFSETTSDVRLIKKQALIHHEKNMSHCYSEFEFDTVNGLFGHCDFFRIQSANENDHLADDITYYFLFFKRRKFNEKEVELAKKVLSVYHYSMKAMDFKFKQRKLLNLKIILMALLLLSFIPVPMSIVTPVEVVADSPYVVTAPFDGVIDTIEVEANQTVMPGQKIVQFDDILARNDFSLAVKKYEVSKAKFENVRQLAFYDNKASYEVSVTEAELELAKLERNYAKEVLDRSSLYSTLEGVPIYKNKSDLEGRPVKIGEKLFEIVNPNKIKYKVSIPVQDLSLTKEGDEVSIYLDSSPLGGYEAKITSMSYLPDENNHGEINYIAYAKPLDYQVNRIGSRGTARIYNGTSPLFWQLIRTPIHYVRMKLGV